VNRFLATIVVLLFAAMIARADLLPPGTKNIPVNHKIETEQEHPDWVFFIVRGSGGVQKVALNVKKPIVIPGSGGVGNGPVPQPGAKPRTIPYRANALVAVPKDAVKDYKNDKELHAAIEDGKVAGMHAVNGHFSDHENAKVTDARKSIEQRYRLTRLDAKDGAILEPIKPEEKPPADGKLPGAVEGIVPDMQWIFPWIAGGLGLAAVVGLAGVLVIGRTRRR
jgi:hypothetical protein